MINTITHYLKIQKYDSECREKFKNDFKSHPDYPSLYAITDTLTMMGIDNVAARVTKEQFSDLPNEFLTLLSTELTLVEKRKDKIVLTNDKHKKQYPANDFLSEWDGIVIGIEPNAQNTTLKKVTLWKKWALYWPLIILSFTLFSYTVLKSPDNFIYIIECLSCISGLWVSVFIILQKYAQNTHFAGSQFCDNGKNVSCQSVLESKEAKITTWLHFSDLPFLFFGSSALAMLYNASAYGLYTLLSVISLPIILYSLWLQKFRLKKWCTLCLAISLLLILNSILYFYEPVYTPLRQIIPYFNILLLFGAVWFGLKIILEKYLLYKEENEELKRFKKNKDVFHALLKPFSLPNHSNPCDAIEIGNSNSNVMVTLIVSPSCSFCYTAYKEITELLNQFEQHLRISIVFNLNPDNTDNAYQRVVSLILSLSVSFPDKAKDALDDWFIKQLSLENWLNKWGNYPDVGKDIQRLQYNWCRQNTISYTPAYLINQFVYPKQYKISELKYFISEFFTENKEP